MSDTTTCPFCGAPLPPDAPRGLCPQCLYRAGLGEVPFCDAIDESALPMLREFGDYELLEEIGHGGMGVVYKARQKSLDRIVALKVLLFGAHATTESVKRFRAEAVATAGLQHPNIVAVHEVGFCAGQHYIAMDFVEGQPLSALIRSSPLPSRRAALYVKAIAEAIHFAHERGILHRDIKPANVLVDLEDHPRVTDFGLAKRLEGDAEETLGERVLGSPNYIPPEQATGKRTTPSRRSDVYALGAVLYHALTGRPPFLGESVTETVQQVLNTEPVSPRLLIQTVPRDLETVCLKCLEKEPARRYATAQMLADELGRFLEGKPVEARPVNRAARLWRWSRRNPQLATAIGAAVLMLFVGLAGVSWQWRRAEAQRRRAAANELIARQSAYASDVLLAQHVRSASNLWLAEALLEKHRPKVDAGTRQTDSEVDFRGWEWRYLWQLCQPEKSTKLQPDEPPTGPITASIDGTRVAAELRQDRIGVWDLASRRRLTTLPISHRADQLRMSSKGDLLAVATRDAPNAMGIEVWDVHPRDGPNASAIEVWDVNAREVRGTIKGASPVRSLAFSPDGKLLASFEESGLIRLIDWSTGVILTNFHVSSVSRLAIAGVVEFTSDGRRLVIGEGYGLVRIVDLQTGLVLTATNLTQTGDGITAVACAPNSDVIAAAYGYATGCIRFWDARSAEVLGQLTAHPGWVQALVFSPDGRSLASASSDRTIQVWDVMDRAERWSVLGHASEGKALAFLLDSRTLASGCGESVACLWDLGAGGSLSPHTTLTVSHGAGVQAVLEPTSRGETINERRVRRFGFAFTPDGGHFITTDRNGIFGVWETWPTRCVERLPELGSNHWGVALSPDARWLAAGVSSGKLNVWNWRERQLVQQLEIPFEWFGEIRFSQSGRYLIGRTVQDNRSAVTKVWRTNDWGLMDMGGTNYFNICSVAFSPDDRLIGTGSANGVVRLASSLAAEGRPIMKHTGLVTAVLFSPDGRVLASVGMDGNVRLWDVPAGREMPTLCGHRDAYSAAFSRDGRRLATGGGGARDAVLLWDIASQREVLSLEAEGESFFQVAYSPDETTLAATSFAGIAHLWHAPSWEEIRAAYREIAR